jgi:formyl-CoA transferase
MGSAHPNLVPYRAFEVDDGWFVIGVGSDLQWEKLVQILGIECKDEWKENSGRIAARSDVENCIAGKIKNRSRKELEDLLQGIPCSPVNTISEALQDPQSIDRGLVSNYKGVQVLTSPLRFI